MRGNVAIFVPVVVLGFWTFVVLLLVRFSRAHGQSSVAREPAAPPPVNVPNRNFMNLLEVPVLFYVGCLVLYVTGGASYLAIALAWIYVALRIVHSVIHLTYNGIAHRGAAFAASTVVAVALWVLVAVHVVAAASIPR
jgi:hypothetical protein